MEIDTQPLDGKDAWSAIESLVNQAGLRPRIALVLGSGLGGFAGEAAGAVSIPYAKIPGLSRGSVSGHASRWIVGSIAGVPVHLLAGRRHLYEAIDPQETALAPRLLARLGVRLFIVTNAAGGLARRLFTGDLMLIRDQINLQFRNPLRGTNDDGIGPRFPDMSDPFCPMASALLRRAALRERIALKEGIYAGVQGPNFETRAEVKMLRRLGADAVGMSTVPEVVAARHAGLRVLGISLIANSHVNAAADSTGVTTHAEVLRTGELAAERFRALLRAALPDLQRLVDSPALQGIHVPHSSEPAGSTV